MSDYLFKFITGDVLLVKDEEYSEVFWEDDFVHFKLKDGTSSRIFYHALKSCQRDGGVQNEW